MGTSKSTALATVGDIAAFVHTPADLEATGPVRAKDVKFGIRVSGRHAALRDMFKTLVNGTSGKASEFDALLDTVDTMREFIVARGEDRIKRQTIIGAAAQQRMHMNAAQALDAGIDLHNAEIRAAKKILSVSGKARKALVSQKSNL